MKKPSPACDAKDIERPKYPRRGWIGVDLDGTLAFSGPTPDPLGIGAPVPLMLRRVKHWVKTGRHVKIFTARAADPFQVRNIQLWCVRHGLPELPVTCEKDASMIALWDDRAVGVVTDLGIPLLPVRLGFWQRLSAAAHLLCGAASGLRGTKAVFHGKTDPLLMQHLHEVMEARSSASGDADCQHGAG